MQAFYELKALYDKIIADDKWVTRDWSQTNCGITTWRTDRDNAMAGEIKHRLYTTSLSSTIKYVDPKSLDCIEYRPGGNNGKTVWGYLVE